MNRYRAMFEQVEERSEIALGAFLMLGDPEPATCAGLLDAVVEAGADMVEVGIPFSDPVADGSVIQAAAARALGAGARVADSLRQIAEFRARHPSVPVGILTYANIAVARGVERLCAELAEVGADSLLLADVPSIEAEPFAADARAAGLEWVMIAAENCGEGALDRIAALTTGYTYCVTRFGVTGGNSGSDFAGGTLIPALARRNAPPPIFGFGISHPDQVAAAVRAGAKGVIVGSALVAHAAASDGAERIRHTVRLLKSATKSGRHGTP